MRASIFQSDTAGLTPEQRIGRLRDAAKEASSDLIVCPELFLSGYAVSSNVKRFSEPATGPYAQQIAQVARDTETAIVYGYPEEAGGMRYNAAQCFDAQGVSRANHRKLLLPPGFEGDVLSPGEGLKLFELGGLTLAILICYDAEFPEAVRAAAMSGAQAVVVPTALRWDWDVVANKVMPARAFENGVYLLYANHAGAEGDITYLGASCIVGPNGKDLARAGGSEEVISARLDPEHVAAAQDRLPYHRSASELRARIGFP